MWSSHDPDNLSLHPDDDQSLGHPAAGDFQEFEDEHQEPVARATKRREITIRRHKDITQEDIDLSKKRQSHQGAGGGMGAHTNVSVGR